MKKILAIAVLPFALLLLLSAAHPMAKKPAVLIFSKTNGYRHASIPVGIEAIKKLGAANGFDVVATEDSLAFNKKNLSPSENKAISNINSVVKAAPTEQKKQALQTVLILIKKGTFSSKGLPKSINDFFTANTNLIKNPVKLVEQLFIEVLDRFDLTQKPDEAKKNTNG